MARNVGGVCFLWPSVGGDRLRRGPQAPCGRRGLGLSEGAPGPCPARPPGRAAAVRSGGGGRGHRAQRQPHSGPEGGRGTAQLCSLQRDGARVRPGPWGPLDTASALGPSLPGRRVALGHLPSPGHPRPGRPQRGGWAACPPVRPTTGVLARVPGRLLRVLTEPHTRRSGHSRGRSDWTPERCGPRS